MFRTVGASQLLKHIFDLSVATLDLGINNCVRVIHKSYRVAGCQNIEGPDLSLSGSDFVLADHDIIEIVCEFSALIILVSEDPVEEVAITESVSRKGKWTLLFNPDLVFLVEVAFDS